MSLSHRLKTIAALVPIGTRVCDIGTDHAGLPIYLIKENIASYVYATDIRPLPLKNAEENIKKSGAENIEARLCDGLEGINPQEAETVIIAGIGGEVISGILSRADWLSETKPLIITQPTTSPDILRKYFCDNGFSILSDTAITDNNKLYSVMTARFTGEKRILDDSFYYVGKVDPQTKEGYLYIKKQLNRIQKAANALKNIPEKHQEYIYNKTLSEKLIQILNGE